MKTRRSFLKSFAILLAAPAVPQLELPSGPKRIDYDGTVPYIYHDAQKRMNKLFEQWTMYGYIPYYAADYKNQTPNICTQKEI